MRELRELQLPKLVEALERKAEGLDQRPIQSSSSSVHLSQSSLSSDQTPVSSTFSLRGPTRVSSASSSIASSPMVRASFDDYSPKSLLTDVVEEPFQEKVDDCEMVDAHPRDSKGKFFTTTSSALGNDSDLSERNGLTRSRLVDCNYSRRCNCRLSSENHDIQCRL